MNDFKLYVCTIYTACEPCPIGLGAIYWARPDKVYFGCNKKDAADAGFDDDFIYKEIPISFDKRSIHFEQCSRELSLKIFQKWKFFLKKFFFLKLSKNQKYRGFEHF